MAKHLLKKLTLIPFLLLIVHKNVRANDAGNRLYFTENKGQVTDQHGQRRTDIDFKLDAGNGLTIFIGKGIISYQWLQSEENKTITYCRMETTLLYADADATITISDTQDYYERYFSPLINQNNSNDGTKARSFRKITYHDIYPGIDWVLFLNKEDNLEHEFVVHPGAKPEAIQIQYRGTQDLRLMADGSIRAVTAKGSISEKAPYAYTKEDKEVPVSFKLDSTTLRYEVAPYSGQLIIDPVLEWGTYFGGESEESVAGIATDKWGDVYMSGSTGSISNIATTGSYQGVFAGGEKDVFICKRDSSGTLLWATYYGGTNVDEARAIACDTSGNVLLLGATNSAAGIATTGSFQEAKLGTANRYDAFLVKFDASGIRQWGTYFGGTLNEGNTPNSGGLTTGVSNNIYISSVTQSDDLPVTSNAYQAVRAGYDDVFIARFSETGDLVWSTYYGGESSDFPFSIAADSAANLYLTGYTQSISGISSAGAYQETNAGGQDAFIAKFDSSGNRVWATYYGGEELDKGIAAIFDPYFDKIYIGGITLSAGGITSPGSFQSIFSGGTGGDVFLTCFDLDGSRVWGTYYGDDQPESLWQLWSNSIGEVYMIGETYSENNVATPGAIHETISGVQDAFLAKFDMAGQRIWSTYLGGTAIESYLELTGFNTWLYVAGATNSANNISTDNSALAGGNDAFLLKINDCEPPARPLNIEGSTEVCSHSETIYVVAADEAAATYQWLLPVGWQGSSDSNSITVIAGENGGVIQVLAISACGGISDTQSLAVSVLPSPEPQVINSNNILATTQPYESYQWVKNGVNITGATNPTYIVTENGTYHVRVSSANDCYAISDTILITGMTGLNDLPGNKVIRIYPNPVINDLLIDAPQQGAAILSTMDGREVKKVINIKAGVNRWDVSYLPPGVYRLQIQLDKTAEQFKIIKQ